jgi:hypothetical protein
MLRNINPIFLEGGQHTSERQYVITSFLSPGRGVSLLQNIQVLHDANLMGNLGETDILPRQIETNKQIYLFAKNTKKKQKKIICSLS